MGKGEQGSLTRTPTQNFPECDAGKTIEKPAAGLWGSPYLFRKKLYP